MLCVDLVKGKLTVKEALGNLREMIDELTDEHYYEVLVKIEEVQKEVE